MTTIWNRKDNNQVTISMDTKSNLSSMPQILRLDASGRHYGSISRELADYLVGRLKELYPRATLNTRDLIASQLPFVDDEMIEAFFTSEAQRTESQKQCLELSHALINELRSADYLIVAAPIYNFSIPATLKAWIDLICRSGLTFRFTENGPVGLLKDRKTYLIAVSAGTLVGSDIDFMTSYMKHIFNFIGIKDVELIVADGRADREVKLVAAQNQIENSLKQWVKVG